MFVTWPRDRFQSSCHLLHFQQKVECSKHSLPRNFIIPLRFAHVTVEVLLSQASIKSVTTRLEQALASLLVMSDMELVMVFVLVCRALGLNTR